MTTCIATPWKSCYKYTWGENESSMGLARKEEDANAQEYIQWTKVFIQHSIGTRTTQFNSSIYVNGEANSTLSAVFYYSMILIEEDDSNHMCTYTMADCNLSQTYLNQKCARQCSPCNSYPWLLRWYLHWHSGCMREYELHVQNNNIAVEHYQKYVIWTQSYRGHV